MMFLLTDSGDDGKDDTDDTDDDVKDDRRLILSTDNRILGLAGLAGCGSTMSMII